MKEQTICFFLGAMKLGGIGKTSMNLMRTFLDRGIKVDLYLTHHVGEYLSQIPSEVNVVVGEGNYLVRVAKYSNYLRRSRPEAVISARDSLNFFNIVCCSLFSKKTIRVVTLRTNQTVENFYQGTKNSALKTFFLKKAYKRADKIIAVSQGVAEDFSQRFHIDINNVEVIYNPVYKEYKETSDMIDSPLRKEFSSPEFKFLLGVGRLRKQKDFSSLIEAFKVVSDQKKEISLIILGEGEERVKLENLVEELGLKGKVFLPGFVSNPQFYMSRAEVFVLSSLWEGFGNVLVDALGVGCKIVSTNCPSGPNEILENGKYGVLVEPKNVEQLSKGIIQMLDTEVQREGLIMRAKEFSIDTIATQYLKYIFNGKSNRLR